MTDFQLRRDLTKALCTALPLTVNVQDLNAVVDALVPVVQAHVASAHISERPRLHKGASRAQIESVDLATLSISKKRILVLHALSNDVGQTCDSLERRLDKTHQSVSAVLNWLERHGLVARDLTKTRTTRAGGRANPYYITEAGHKALRLANEKASA